MNRKTFERLLAKANADGDYVLSGADWGSKWTVHNPKNGSGWYNVFVSDNGRALICNCRAGRQQMHCKHVALVRHKMELLAVAQFAGLDPLDDERSAPATEPVGYQASLFSSNTPISIFKPEGRGK
jgi:hypothetical protein